MIHFVSGLSPAGDGVCPMTAISETHMTLLCHGPMMYTSNNSLSLTAKPIVVALQRESEYEETQVTQPGKCFLFGSEIVFRVVELEGSDGTHWGTSCDCFCMRLFCTRIDDLGNLGVRSGGVGSKSFFSEDSGRSRQC